MSGAIFLDKSKGGEGLTPAAGVIPVVQLPGQVSDYYFQDGPDEGKPNLTAIAKVLSQLPGFLPEGTEAVASIFTRIVGGDRVYATTERFETSDGPAVMKFCDTSLTPLEISQSTLQLDKEMLQYALQNGLSIFPKTLFCLEIEHKGAQLCLGIVSRFENICRTLQDVRQNSSPEEIAAVRLVVEGIVKAMNDGGYFLWDCQGSNFTELDNGTWICIDPGSFGPGTKAAQNAMFHTMFERVEPLKNE